jgi:hypothetical protein
LLKIITAASVIVTASSYGHPQKPCPQMREHASLKSNPAERRSHHQQGDKPGADPPEAARVSSVMVCPVRVPR